MGRRPKKEWNRTISQAVWSCEPEAVLRGRVPGHIYTSVVDRTDFVELPVFERVQQRPRVAGVHLAPRKRHLARTEVLRPVGKLERRKIGVHAITARLWNRWYDELMERRAARRPTLILLSAVLAR